MGWKSERDGEYRGRYFNRKNEWADIRKNEKRGGLVREYGEIVDNVHTYTETERRYKVVEDRKEKVEMEEKGELVEVGG